MNRYFGDCVDEVTPFGSDEGSEAYYELRNWREANPNAPLTECFDWMHSGNLNACNESLASDAQIEIDTANLDAAFLGDHYDMFTLDATIIPSGFGQLMAEGAIDPSAKIFINVAIKRQPNPKARHCDDSTL